MPSYNPPLRDMQFLMHEVFKVTDDYQQMTAHAEVDADTINAVLEEAGKFAANVTFPLNISGDAEGCVLNKETHEVTTPKGFKEAYQKYVEGGWPSLSCDTAYGGQGLPFAVNSAVYEMLNSANQAWTMYPGLSHGAYEALHVHGTEEQKKLYLPKLTSGEWTGTMCLTEPHCGTDLGLLRTKAEPVAGAPEGTYKITGNKIFISAGEHDFTDNIVHLVLARLPDAPAGTRGISLFLVPKFLVNEDGSLGPRNDAYCHSIEHKLGIHGSPTCTMIYGDGRFGGEPGAIGWLIGEETRGLACMFTMMNTARLAVGMQGVAIAEAATQKAIAYAKERTQGKAPGWQDSGMSPIIEHPDVARMLLTMKVLTQGARAITYACAHAVDLSHGEEARHWSERASLLTPVAKSFATDAGVDVSSLGVQVHGGMGFIEETGAARLYRDARIAPIYEVTHGIQAIELVTRKLPLSDDTHIRGFIAELRDIAASARAANAPALGETGARLEASIADLEAATEWLLATLADGRQAEALAGATPYQRLFGLVLTGAYLAKGALADGGDGRNGERAALCRFAAENVIGETAALKERVVCGAASLQAARVVLE